MNISHAHQGVCYFNNKKLPIEAHGFKIYSYSYGEEGEGGREVGEVGELMITTGHRTKFDKTSDQNHQFQVKC